MTELKHLKEHWEAIFSCMGCGDCGYSIRTAVGRYLTCAIKEAKGEGAFELYFSRGRMNVLKSILEGQIPLSRELADWVFQCSECGNCTEVCHMTHNENIILPTCQWIDHVKVWDALRKDLVEAGFAPLEKHENLVSYMQDDKKRNPYGEDSLKRYDWLTGLTNINERGDYVFFAGCTMPLRQQETLKNMMKILEASGIDLAISKDEWCCGSISARIGEYNTIEELVGHNVEVFKEIGTSTLVTACAGCYRTIKKDYPELLGEDLPFEVKHITEILINLLRENKIPFKSFEGEKIKVTYHDPCHLGRHMNFYDIPRELISNIPGIDLTEMKRNRQHAWCCGAGGGVKSQFPDISNSISMERINEAIESGAQILTTSCPFCIGNFLTAYEGTEPDIKEKIKVIDLIDLLASRI